MPHRAAVLAMIAKGNPLYVVAAAQLANNASIPLSSNGALPGDIIIVACYEENGSFTVSGSGWTSAGGYTAGSSYTGAHFFKTLAAGPLSDLTTSGSQSGFFYVVLRGPSAASLAFGPSNANTSSRNVVFPTPGASAYACAILTLTQGGADLAGPNGYIDEGFFPSIHNANMFTQNPAPSAGHTDVLSGISTGGIALLIYGFEFAQ